MNGVEGLKRWRDRVHHRGRPVAVGDHSTDAEGRFECEPLSSWRACF
jgi:hypothetical protein